MPSKKDVGAIVHKNHASFRVWAPYATSVGVVGAFNNWTETPLAAEGDGYWYGEVSKALAGQEYKFVINGNAQKNDPRARQMTTDNGNSVLVGSGFDWEGDKFQLPPIEQQVIYELHVGTFHRSDPATSGTFQDVIDKLDYLASLGVTTIELMPVTSMNMDRGWGYSPDYLYAVESLYGGRYGLMSFVKAAHQKGLGVILDVVYNHFTPDGSLDMWRFDGWSQDDKGGIYFYADWRSKTPWGERPDFGRPEVRQFIADNVRMWLHEFHLDGLRVDSTIYIRNVEGHNNDPANDLPDGWKLLQEISRLGKRIKPSALMVAEDIGYNDYLTKPTTQGGAGFVSQWQVNFPGVLRAVLEPLHDVDRNLAPLCEVLNGRFNGDAFQRVIYSDSHDSAANGSQRLNEEISPGNPASIFARQRSLLAAGIVLTAPGIPMLLQGQEFFEGGSFNDWQTLDWSKAEHFAGMVEAHRHMIALALNRYGTTRGLTGQSFTIVVADEAQKVLAYRRWQDGGTGDDVVVVCNLANIEQSDYQLSFPADGTWHVRFRSDWPGYSQDFKGLTSTQISVENGQGALTIGPYAMAILSQNPGD